MSSSLWGQKVTLVSQKLCKLLFMIIGRLVFEFNDYTIFFGIESGLQFEVLESFVQIAYG